LSNKDKDKHKQNTFLGKQLVRGVVIARIHCVVVAAILARLNEENGQTEDWDPVLLNGR
jgi:hypothetical protein